MVSRRSVTTMALALLPNPGRMAESDPSRPPVPSSGRRGPVPRQTLNERQPPIWISTSVTIVGQGLTSGRCQWGTSGPSFDPFFRKGTCWIAEGVRGHSFSTPAAGFSWSVKSRPPAASVPACSGAIVGREMPWRHRGLQADRRRPVPVLWPVAHRCRARDRPLPAEWRQPPAAATSPTASGPPGRRRRSARPRRGRRLRRPRHEGIDEVAHPGK